MLVAVTGGIGSGKSAVVEEFRRRGASVLGADAINAELLRDPGYVERLGALFPSVVHGGEVDRKALGALIFRDEAARKRLNALAHPLILAEISRRAASLRGLAVVEIPLLAEAEAGIRFDKIVAVTASRAVRVARIVRRDGVNEEYAERAIDAQLPDADIVGLATDVVENNGGKAELFEAVGALLSRWGQKSE